MAGRKRIYAEGIDHIHLSLPLGLKPILVEAAQAEGRSVSALSVLIFEQWLRRSGYLRERAERLVAVSTGE